MPVYEYYNRYVSPAAYDDLLTIQVDVPEWPTSRILFNYEVFNEDHVLLSKAYTRLAFLNKRSKGLPKHPLSSGSPCVHFSAKQRKLVFCKQPWR